MVLESSYLIENAGPRLSDNCAEFFGVNAECIQEDGQSKAIDAKHVFTTSCPRNVLSRV